MSAKILLLDIETHPIVAAVWELFETTAVWVESDTYLLSFSAKWYGGKTKTYCLPDFCGYRKYTDKDDKKLVGKLHELLNEADIVVAHNGDSFDIKKIRARFLVHGFDPPRPFKTVDTLKIAKSMRFDSNKLDNLGRYLGVGRKIPNTGAKLWRDCGLGKRKAWGEMRRYNTQDVDLLERVYDKLKPWAKTHPNIALFKDRPGCRTCGSHHVKKDGFDYRVKRKVQQWQCLDCGHYFS